MIKPPSYEPPAKKVNLKEIEQKAQKKLDEAANKVG